MLLKECTGHFSFWRRVCVCIVISVEESKLTLIHCYAKRIFFTWISFIQKLPPVALQHCALRVSKGKASPEAKVRFPETCDRSRWCDCSPACYFMMSLSLFFGEVAGSFWGGMLLFSLDAELQGEKKPVFLLSSFFFKGKSELGKWEEIFFPYIFIRRHECMCVCGVWVFLWCFFFFLFLNLLFF